MDFEVRRVVGMLNPQPELARGVCCGNSTRLTVGVSLPQKLGGYVTKFALQTALKLIARGKLAFDGRVVVQRVTAVPGLGIRVRGLGFRI